MNCYACRKPTQKRYRIIFPKVDPLIEFQYLCDECRDRLEENHVIFEEVKRMKKGYCKVCALDPIIVRIIESFLRNEGYRKKPCRPLSYEKIAHVIYLVFDVELGRKTIGKHFRKCMKSNQIDRWKEWKKIRKER